MLACIPFVTAAIDNDARSPNPESDVWAAAGSAVEMRETVNTNARMVNPPAKILARSLRGPAQHEGDRNLTNTKSPVGRPISAPPDGSPRAFSSCLRPHKPCE